MGARSRVVFQSSQSAGAAGTARPSHPAVRAARLDGRPGPADGAREAAAEVLDAADMPLAYALGNSTCESQRAAMMLAEQIGAVIDSHTSLTYGPGKIAGQLAG